MTFNPNQHLIQLKSREGSKDYLPVQWRLVWFRECCPQGTIDTEEMEVDLDREVEAEAFVWNNEKRRSEKVVKRGKGYARYKAIVTDGKGGRATGTKSENAAEFPDYAEKAETGAIGRALAGLGYGTQFTGDEFSEGERLADAPVSREPAEQPAQPAQPQVTPSAPAQPAPRNEAPQVATPRASTPAPVAPGNAVPKTSKDALTDLLERTKARAESLGMLWDDVKRDAGLSNKPDGQLQPFEIGKINGTLGEYEKRAKSRSAA